jgi:hypothetical protein
MTRVKAKLQALAEHDPHAGPVRDKDAKDEDGARAS